VVCVCLSGRVRACVLAVCVFVVFVCVPGGCAVVSLCWVCVSVCGVWCVCVCGVCVCIVNLSVKKDRHKTC